MQWQLSEQINYFSKVLATMITTYKKKSKAKEATEVEIGSRCQAK